MREAGRIQKSRSAETAVGSDRVEVAGIDIAWKVEEGTCTFESLPVAMMWIDTTLAGVMSGVQAMVGEKRFALALQSQGRASVEADWEVISRCSDFSEGFRAIANIAAVAGWGNWTLVSIDEARKECRFRITESWEGRYQNTLGVCWGSGMLAGKLAGYCSKLFGTNCWADQTTFIARGDEYDEFFVHPSERSIEQEIEDLLASDEATRADMAVALRKLQDEVARRQTAERALRETHERLMEAQEIAGLAAWDWDIVNNEVWWSSDSERLFGVDPDEVISSYGTFLAAIHDADREFVKESLRRALYEGAPYDVEFRVARPDDRPMTVRSIGAVALGESGEPVRMRGMIHDITAHKQLEDQLRSAQKMEAIGQLTGGVAHDFNNLLAVIHGNAELLRENLRGQPGLLELLDGILGASERGANLTQRLLAFSRKQILRPEVIDLNACVDGMLGLLRRALGENIEIDVVPGVDLWRCEVDRVQLETVLLNLALNARDAMPRGGSITIETVNARLDDEFAARQAGVEPGEYLVLEVSDTGSGMPPEILERIFEPFFTTKEMGRGTGLGLSMAHGFVEQSGGHIQVRSDVGQGTTVRIHLPRSHKELASRRPAPAGTADRSAGGESVLVVEDDDAVRALVVALLDSLGYRVLEAATGEAGLAALDENPRVELLLTDVVLSADMSGWRLAEESRRRRPGLKVLYMSGYAEEALAHEGRLDAGLQMLQKPFRREEFAQKVRVVLSDGEA